MMLVFRTYMRSCVHLYSGQLGIDVEGKAPPGLVIIQQLLQTKHKIHTVLETTQGCGIIRNFYLSTDK